MIFRFIKVILISGLVLLVVGGTYISIKFSLLNSLHWKISGAASNKFFEEKSIMPEVVPEKTNLDDVVHKFVDEGFECSSENLNEQKCLKKTFNLVCNSFLEITLTSNNKGIVTKAMVANIERGCL